MSGTAAHAPPRLWPYPLVAGGVLFLGTLYNQWVIGARALPGSQAASRLAPDQAAGLLALGFLLQALLNPLVGSLGDRLRRRGGSRRGLILVGAPLQALGFFAVWQPGSLAGAPVAAAILFTSAAMVLVNQPWSALLPALAPEQRLRVRLSALSGGCGLLGAVAALVAGPLLVERGGPAALGPAGALTFLGLVLLPTLLLREPPLRGAQGPAEGWALGGAGTLLRRRPVQRVIAAQGLLGLAVLSLTAVVPPAAAHLVQRPPVQLNAWLAGGMLAGPLLLGLLGDRLGPERLLGLAGVLGAGALLALTLLRPAAFAPWAAGLSLLGAVALLALAVPPVLLAGLADQDGAAREGLLFGLGGTALCLGQATGSGLTGALLGASPGPQELQRVLLGAAAALGLGALVLLPAGLGHTPARVE